MEIFGTHLELVILDVDGTILDIRQLKVNLEAAARALDIPEEPIQTYFRDVQNGSKRGYASFSQTIRLIFPFLTSEEGIEFERRFREIEIEHPYPPIKGSVETIRWLKDSEVSVALCTTNSYQGLVHRLHAVGINTCWFVKMATRDDPFCKPDPRTLDPIFQASSVPREHAVFVGDWYPDLETARGAGVRFIAVLSGGIPYHAFINEGIPENHIIPSLASLRSLITEASAPARTAISLR